MTAEERGIEDLNRRLEEGRRGFGGGSARCAPHPSRPASSIARYQRAQTVLLWVCATALVLICSVR